ncbi:DNA-protecting protein DprA [Patescibacteria group bacterium]|nr:DNA-protecting protein DprA [Patescibacteria group bacterium]
MTDSNNLKYLITLSHFQKIGPQRLKLLQKHFPTTKDIFFAKPEDLIDKGLSPTLAYEFNYFRKNFNFEEAYAKYEKEDIKFCAITDDNYPKLLKDIHDPPIILYYKGYINCLNNFSISVVGSRKFTTYGRQACEDIVFKLAKNGLVIVSGLALGIDSLAHCAALEAGGITVGVLGTGVNRTHIYPASNRKLAERMIEAGGVIISEFPFGTLALKYNFPLRNRIIAGLTRGTLVIEANAKSGTLITAHSALDSGREVMAIPGSIYSETSAGTHKLIDEGAKLVTCAEDILKYLNLEEIKNYIENKTIKSENPTEEKILANLSKKPIHINELIGLTQLDTRTINSTLTIMEMKGMVKNTGNMMYIIK